ncbi:MAG: hypothetical protein M1823_001124 [Watsoniomyces obsoletus]|nr:MAG: hypothetical protein M1823_001124 [Watsoniomyces obsoletus]
MGTPAKRTPARTVKGKTMGRKGAGNGSSDEEEKKDSDDDNTTYDELVPKQPKKKWRGREVEGLNKQTRKTPAEKTPATKIRKVQEASKSKAMPTKAASGKGRKGDLNSNDGQDESEDPSNNGTDQSNEEQEVEKTATKESVKEGSRKIGRQTIKITHSQMGIKDKEEMKKRAAEEVLREKAKKGKPNEVIGRKKEAKDRSASKNNEPNIGNLPQTTPGCDPEALKDVLQKLHRALDHMQQEGRVPEQGGIVDILSTLIHRASKGSQSEAKERAQTPTTKNDLLLARALSMSIIKDDSETMEETVEEMVEQTVEQTIESSQPNILGMLFQKALRQLSQESEES